MRVEAVYLIFLIAGILIIVGSLYWEEEGTGSFGLRATSL
jgi:hypothetical protein